MAKKDPTDLTVEEKLKTLFQLQAALSAIDEKRALRGELPLEVQDLEDEIAGLTTRVEKIQNEIAEFQRAITQKKGEIVEAETSVARYKSQLDEVKNNREYDTLSKEIEFQTLEIELCNKKIREANARIQDKKNELQANEEVIAERQSDLDMKKSELEEIMTETRAEEDKLKEKASVSVRMPATVWVSSMYSVMPVVVASTRSRPSVSLTSRCTRRSLSASTADVS